MVDCGFDSVRNDSNSFGRIDHDFYSKIDSGYVGNVDDVEFWKKGDHADSSKSVDEDASDYGGDLLLWGYGVSVAQCSSHYLSYRLKRAKRTLHENAPAGGVAPYWVESLEKYHFLALSAKERTKKKRNTICAILTRF